MWVEIFRKVIAFFFVGISIKLLDDNMDLDKDNKYKIEILNEIQHYTLPYGLVFLAFSMLLDKYYSFSLFSSAYIIGMFNFINRKLPLKIKAYHEIIIIITINLIFIPYKIFVHSFFTIGTIQLLDDLLDMRHDMIYGYFNLANKYGKGEIFIFSIILITMSIMLSTINTILILIIWFLINYLYS